MTTDADHIRRDPPMGAIISALNWTLGDRGCMAELNVMCERTAASDGEPTGRYLVWLAGSVNDLAVVEPLPNGCAEIDRIVHDKAGVHAWIDEMIDTYEATL